MIENMCKFIAEIEQDPEALVTGMTIKDYLLLRQHIQDCDNCYLATERVNSKYKQTEPDINDTFNVN